MYAVTQNVSILSYSQQNSTHFPYTTLFRSLAHIALDPTRTLLRFFRNPEQKNYHTHELHLLVGDVYVLIKAHSYQNVMADRKSTRLNSSHVRISYAVFC